MKSFAAGLIAVTLAGTTVSALADDSAHSTMPPVTSVRRIDIVASWGGLGPAEYEHTVIQRTGGTLVVDDQPVDGNKLEALMIALFAEPPGEPSPNLIARQAQAYSIEYFVNSGLRRCAGDGADLDGPMVLFSRLFDNAQNQRHWFSNEYSAQNFHTDDYPTEKVTLTLEDGATIIASSQSQKALMLPFTVARNGRTYATFDDRLPRAIAALTVGGVNSERLDGGESLFSAYSDWLCDAFRNEIDLAVITAWAPRIAQVITSERIVTDNLRLNDDLSGLYGRLRFPEWPKEVTYQVTVKGRPLDPASVTNAGLRSLRETKERGDAITSLPWVHRWFDNVQNPQMFLESFVGGANSLGWRTAVADLKSRSPAAYRAVTHNLRSVVQGMMSEGKGDQPPGIALFLPNGQTVDLGRGTLIDRQGRTVTQ
ncbi:MAG: hypothetical protein WAK11_04650 [Candidatus Cybelea sp.]